jgi:hypothetical protein
MKRDHQIDLAHFIFLSTRRRADLLRRSSITFHSAYVWGFITGTLYLSPGSALDPQGITGPWNRRFFIKVKHCPQNTGLNQPIGQLMIINQKKFNNLSNNQFFFKNNDIY